jgi:hypothetical protein
LRFTGWDVVLNGEGEEAVETCVGAAARTTGALEPLCVLVEGGRFLVVAWAGGRLSVYWSATGTAAVLLELVLVGVVAVVLVVVVVAPVVDDDVLDAGVVDVDVEVVAVEPVGGVAAVAPAAGRVKPIVATSTPKASRGRRDRRR